MTPLSVLKQSSKRMKQYPTQAESIAYRLLRESGFKYKKQLIFGFYILDILIPNRLLVVEIDGPCHKEGNKHDQVRNQFCKEHGLKVLRIKNAKVETIIAKVKTFKKVNNYKEKLDKIVKKAAKVQKDYEKQYKNR